MKRSPFIALLAMGCCLLLMSFSSNSNGDEEVAVKYKYLYLVATSQNINGDAHAYSKVLKVRANTSQMMANDVQDLLFAFEDQLYAHFPQSSFIASHNWVAGTFAEAAKAELRRQEAMSAEENAIEILLNGGIVRY